jgi:hypothetical protein
MPKFVAAFDILPTDLSGWCRHDDFELVLP